MNGYETERPRRRLGQHRLRVLTDIVAMSRRVKQMQLQLLDKDKDLGDQLGRALHSIGLNASEGCMARGRKRASQLDIAMGSGREAIMALELAAAFGFLDEEAVEREADDIDRIVATLYKVAQRKA